MIANIGSRFSSVDVGREPFSFEEAPIWFNIDPERPAIGKSKFGESCRVGDIFATRNGPSLRTMLALDGMPAW